MRTVFPFSDIKVRDKFYFFRRRAQRYIQVTVEGFSGKAVKVFHELEDGITEHFACLPDYLQVDEPTPCDCMMTNEKCYELLLNYKKALEEQEDSGNTEHCRGMIPKMHVFLDQGRREKFIRWLGFLQGAMWAEGMYTIWELKCHNRTERDENDTD